MAAGFGAVRGQGLTEVLPISSSGPPGDRVAAVLRRRRWSVVHRGLPTRHRAAVLVYFAGDIVRILKAWFNGIFVKAHRTDPDTQPITGWVGM